MLRRTRRRRALPGYWAGTYVANHETVGVVLEEMEGAVRRHLAASGAGGRSGGLEERDRVWLGQALSLIRWLRECSEPERVRGADWVERYPYGG